jgi:hypothetical protein
MAKPQHRTREHLTAYQAIKRAQAAGEQLECAEVECVMDSRVIYPDQAADVAHDTTGTYVIGASHMTCNRREAAIRGNAMRLGRWNPKRLDV